MGSILTMRLVKIPTQWLTSDETLMNLGNRPRNYQRDVILLFSAGKLPDGSDDCLEKRAHRKMAGLLKDIDQPAFAEFFPVGAPGFRDSVRIKNQRIARSQLHLSNFAFPSFKQSHYRASSVQPLHGSCPRASVSPASASAQQKWGKMSAIRVS